MYDDILKSLNDSELRKKRQIEHSSNEYSLGNCCELYPSLSVVSTLVIRNILNYQYFDPCKLTWILKKIHSFERNKIIVDLKLKLCELTVSIKDNSTKGDEYNKISKMFSSLSDYVSKKLSYDKTKFFMNPKYYKVSSKIDIDGLKAALNNQDDQNLSLVKYSAETKVPYGSLLNTTQKILGFRYNRKPNIHIRRISNSSKNILQTYFLKKKYLLDDKIKFIYIDESCFNNSKHNAKKWTHITSPNFNLNKGRVKSLNLIIAISNHRVESYFINHKRNTGETFLTFLKGLVKKLKADPEYNEDYENRQFCIYMDNAPIHKPKKIRSYLESTKLNILFSPPYHPDINPAEYVFRKLKRSFYTTVIQNR